MNDQMANSTEILDHVLARNPSSPAPIVYQWLVPNSKGMDNFLGVWTKHDAPRARDSSQGGTELSIFTAATESFTKKNTNCTIAESLERFKPIFAAAKANDLKVRAYISVALGCPYEGPDVDPRKVADLAVSLLELGAEEISVADTTGMGTAPKTRNLLKALAAAGVDVHDLALHFHDTYGQALVNTVVGLEAGVRTFDSAVGGLGGCPYSPGATGNVASEDMVYMFESLGLKTGVDLQALAEIGEWISNETGRPNESRTGKATLARLRQD
jgi:hydroxymethylglutaryl-CoA lyase